MTQMTHCDEYGQLNRREFLWHGLHGAASLFWGGLISPIGRPLPKIVLADPHRGPRGDTLVCIFLRGGADGLNMVVPFGDEAYYQNRPTLAIPRPDAAQPDGRAINLDGFFALHPALEPLFRLFSAGELALIQATGSPDESRSHFEAMDLMERGAVPGAYTGWLARHLVSLDTGNDSPLRGIAIDDRLPLMLAGSSPAVPIPDLATFGLRIDSARQKPYRHTLSQLYERSGDEFLKLAAEQTMAAVDLIASVETDRGRIRQRGRPAESPFSQALQSVAALIKAEVGVEVAAVDFGGWDTHVSQGGSQGQMANLLASFATGLTSFYEALGDRRNQVTVLVMSEFGRRAAENAGQGTDHGHGNMMLVLGGQINGGRVYADWPGLSRDLLVGAGDLAITIDYRHILAEIIQKRLNNPQIGEIFPDFRPEELGLA